MISVRLQGKQFNIMVIQVYASNSNAEEADVEWFYEDLQDLVELTPQKRCPFHYRGVECKTILAFALLHSVLQGQICLLLQVFLDFLLLHSSPL